jgi:Icc-related predicted phosphoesterase
LKIIAIGDTHAEWGTLNAILNKKQPDIAFVVGDFGYWPNEYHYDMKQIKPGNAKIYWCDGNHEDHYLLNQVTNNEIVPNVFYMKRGSVLTINDKNVLFIGGADSIDKNQRTAGFDWFPEELISHRDIENLPDVHIDIVISHTCPFAFKMHEKTRRYDKAVDPSQHALSIVLKKYKPRLWVFGHWHQFAQGYYKNTRWFSLNTISQGHGDCGRSFIDISHEF